LIAPVRNEAAAVPASRYSKFETLRDGTRVEIRAQRNEDRADLLEAFDRLSAQSRYTRFFAPKSGFSEAEIAQFMKVDFVDHVALMAVAQVEGGPRIVGAGRYIVSQPGAAEIAFAVDDSYQGRGVASAVIRSLAAIARAAGIDSFHAEVLAENAPMLRVFEKSGLAMSKKREQGIVHATLRLH
jgi:RimJ/RimL family protein N-acetyltransferase